MLGRVELGRGWLDAILNFLQRAIITIQLEIDCIEMVIQPIFSFMSIVLTLQIKDSRRWRSQQLFSKLLHFYGVKLLFRRID